MTETQWLTSDNPSALVAFLGERITDEQRLFFVAACRKEFAKVIKITEWDACEVDEMRMAFIQWIGWSKEAIVSKPLRAEILRDIMGNPFRPIMRFCGGHRPLWQSVPNDGYFYSELPLNAIEFDSAWLTWNDRTIPLMVDAMMFEECGECNRGEWPDLKWIDHCDKCKGTQRIPRAEPRWEMMLEIADALEDGAGCRDQHILEHLRDAKCECSIPSEGQTNIIPGSIFVGWGHGWQPCSTCNGTGWIKRRHYIGCHIIEQLKGTSL